MSAPRKSHPVSSLSFVHDEAPASKKDLRRCFWHVTSTGEVQADQETGQRLALEYLRFADDIGLEILPWIVMHMPRELTGVEVGFLDLVGRAAHQGRPEAERIVRFWEHGRRQAASGALVNQRPDGSVVIEQPDGKRDVYRKVGETA